jgi:hypothetical protein
MIIELLKSRSYWVLPLRERHCRTLISGLETRGLSRPQFFLLPQRHGSLQPAGLRSKNCNAKFKQSLSIWPYPSSGGWPLRRSRVERASRSSRVTITTSPGPVPASNRRSCRRSVLAPLATSRNTFPAPAARSWRTCAASLCPPVDQHAAGCANNPHWLRMVSRSRRDRAFGSCAS